MAINSQADLGRALLSRMEGGQTKLAWTKYIPHTPSAKQLAFMMLPHREALYGGRPGAGKSDVLLADALRFFDVPYYSAIIFRLRLTDLKQNEGLLHRAHEWLDPWYPEVRYEASTHMFVNTTNGANLTFGYMGSFLAWQHYQGGSYQFCGWDELTQHSQYHYEEMFSRNRRLYCPHHAGRVIDGVNYPLPFDPGCETCIKYDGVSHVPLRVRGATNPGGPGHCVPYGEVLTPTGWRDIKDFEVGDSVFTLTDDGRMVESKVNQLYQGFYSGKMATVTQRGFHLCATPNHKVAKLAGTRGDTRKLFSLVPIEDLPGQAYILRTVKWRGSNPSTFTVPDVVHRRLRLNQPRTLSWEHYSELMGWYLSEGSTCAAYKHFTISQQKPLGVKLITKFLRAVGFSYVCTATGFDVSSPCWFNYFKQFGYCYTKFIPNELKASTPKCLRLLFNALMEGDGHWVTKYKSGTYFTTSPVLADDVAEVALKLGYMVYISTRKRDPSRKQCYQVNVKSQKVGATEILTGSAVYNRPNKTKRKPTLQYHDFRGMVYCIGVPKTHNFIIRQHGSIWVSGNTWVKKRFSLYKDKDRIDPVTGERGVWLSKNPNRPFLPATFRDNPFIDHDAYQKSLDEIADPERRAQLIGGDWDKVEGGRFKLSWFSRKYRFMGGYYAILDEEGNHIRSYHDSEIRKFCVADVACSVQTGVAETSFYESRGAEIPPDWTVLGCFGVTPRCELLVLDVKRFQAEAPEIFDEMKAMCARWQPMFFSIEINGVGKPIAQVAFQMGIPVIEKPTCHDKIANAAEAQIRARNGYVFLPDDALWVDDFIGELTCWKGHPKEDQDDQVDVLSNAAHHLTRVGGNQDRDSTVQLHASELPILHKDDLHRLLMPTEAQFPQMGYW
jgi:predicted phage terminase large subunit-like protein